MGEYEVNPYEELAAKLEVVEKKIDYIVRLLKQNGFKDYEKEAARKANLAWAEEMAKVLNAKLEEDFRKSQDNSKSE